MSELAEQQVIDAAGGFAEIAETMVGVEHAQFDESRVPSPRYADVALAFQTNPEATHTFEIPPLADDRQRLAQFPGLRVTVGVSIPSREGGIRQVYFPGIVLEVRPGQAPLVGILKAGPDALLTDEALQNHKARPLADLQQNLLRRMYGLQAPDAGKHSTAGKANVGESAHGALIAITDSSRIGGLHNRVHTSVTTGLARTISAPLSPGHPGAVDIGVGGRVRPVRDDVVPALEVNTLSVSREHQLPPTDGLLELGIGHLTVGTTLAAVRSKQSLGFPQPDLKAGMTAMAS